VEGRGVLAEEEELGPIDKKNRINGKDTKRESRVRRVWWRAWKRGKEANSKVSKVNKTRITYE